ncbi:hypothetical protein HPP92_003877 [Vanilla planifolia]|uniref:Uncharacterized protein n=1 Tax=Vanilla planifolia TaxID=51239 RepID=A0A835SB90_VANPL|nr:hypothetical protein HPP92_003877 [Vanilla planifolia]
MARFEVEPGCKKRDILTGFSQVKCQVSTARDLVGVRPVLMEQSGCCAYWTTNCLESKGRTIKRFGKDKFCPPETSGENIKLFNSKLSNLEGLSPGTGFFGVPGLQTMLRLEEGQW